MNSKRIISAALSLMIGLSAVGVYADSHWAADDIERMTSMGIVQGNENNEFFPDNFITRAELFTIINRVTGVKNQSGKNFTDVADNAWYKEQVDLAVTAGYVTGYSDGTICPDNYITRAEAATLISRIFKSMKCDKSDFADSDKIGEWAKDGIDILVSLGLINGYADNSFKPDNNITRAEITTILSKAVGDIHSGMGTVKDKVIDGNLIITSGGCTLENVEVKGNVYITNAVEDKEVRFIDCTIHGYVSNDSKNSGAVILDSSSAEYMMFGGLGGVAIVTGKSKLSELYVCGNAEVSTVNCAEGDYGIGEVVVVSRADLTVLENSFIKLLTISESAKRSELEVYGTVESLNSETDAFVNGESVYKNYSSKNVSYSKGSGSQSHTPDKKPSGSGGGGGGMSSPSQGSTPGSAKVYKLTNIAFADGIKINEAYDSETLTYTLDLPFDISSVKMTATCDLGATLKVNGNAAYSDEEMPISDIAEGESKITIELIDGLQTLKTYTINVKRGKTASAQSIETLNDILQATVDAEADSQTILTEMSDAYITDAIMLLISYYKTEYDAQYTGTDLTQRQLIDLVSKVNEEKESLFDAKLGIKADGGNVFTKTVNVSESGMYKLVVKYAPTLSSENNKMAIYIGEDKFESAEMNIDTTKGWQTVELEVALKSGDNVIEMYAETDKDGNFGLLIDDSGTDVTGNKLAVGSVSIVLNTSDFEPVDNHGTRASWLQSMYGEDLADGTKSGSIGGGGILFEFDSPKAQDAKLILPIHTAPLDWGETDWYVAFLNPCKTPGTYSSAMVEGTDYPALADAVYNWRGSVNGTASQRFNPKTVELNVTLQKGKNTLWIPACNLRLEGADLNDNSIWMYSDADNSKKGRDMNCRAYVYKLIVEPEVYPVTSLGASQAK